jgi:hypothetical protein
MRGELADKHYLELETIVASLMASGMRPDAIRTRLQDGGAPADMIAKLMEEVELQYSERLDKYKMQMKVGVLLILGGAGISAASLWAAEKQSGGGVVILLYGVIVAGISMFGRGIWGWLRS